MRNTRAAAVLAGLVTMTDPAVALAQGVEIQTTGEPSGSIIELVMNGGKVGEAKADAAGGGTWALDLANLGKQTRRAAVRR